MKNRVDDFQMLRFRCSADDELDWRCKFDLSAGQRFGSTWEPPEVVVSDARRPVPDIFALGNDSALTLRPRAQEILNRFSDAACEVLPLPHGNEILSVWNILEVRDCLDLANSVIPYGQADRLAFSICDLPHSPLFWVPQLKGRLFCQRSDTSAPDWDFIGAVEEDRITGLRFVEVWNSNDGPLSLDALYAY